MDGYSAKKIFNTPTGYSYDDIIILPDYIDFNVNDVSLFINFIFFLLFIINQ